MLRACLSVFVVLSVAACSKEETKAKPAAPVPVASTTVDGVRHVPVEANKEGYTPDQIPGKPGEKLVLVFTRTVNESCLAQIRMPDGKTIDLPLNKPVEVAVTVPDSG